MGSLAYVDLVQNSNSAITMYLAGLLLSQGTDIRSGVTENAAIDGRGERNRKRLRSTVLT